MDDNWFIHDKLLRMTLPSYDLDRCARDGSPPSVASAQIRSSFFREPSHGVECPVGT